MKTIKCVLVFLSFIAISITLSSCESTVTNETLNPPDNFQLNAWDYSDNHYFVDTLYKRSFTEYYEYDTLTSYIYANVIGHINSNEPLEVWVQCDANNPYKRFCVGTVMLGERPPQGYDSTFKIPETITDKKFAGYFRKLQYDVEYYVDVYTGFIGLNINIPEVYYVGVVYKNSSNQNYGKGAFESYPNDTLILKLIKVDYPGPETTPVAWNLKMKNVYRIPYTNLKSSTTIYTKYNANNVLRDTITGLNTPLITMLKLDRCNNTTYLPPPDGKFDWISGRTINPSTGDIIFPILEPYSKCIAAYGLDSNYIYSEIYSQKKINAQNSPKANLYVIKGNAVY